MKDGLFNQNPEYHTVSTYYQANGWLKFYELSTYEDGCLPHTGGLIDGQERFTSETLQGLLDGLLTFVDGERDCLELNSCDELGRVDISVLENADGYRATRQQIEAWKEGKLELWDSIYTFQVEKIQSEVVNLEEITA